MAEFMHSLHRHQGVGVEAFVAHAENYLSGLQETPTCTAQSLIESKPVLFTFSDDVLKRFVDDRLAVRAYEAAVRYGFRGHSKGEKNGILYQRSKDHNLQAATDRLLLSDSGLVQSDLETLDDLRKVKIVWHNPSGERVVGVYNTMNSRMIFLGFAHY